MGSSGILQKVIITMGILRVTLLLCAVIVLSEAYSCPSGWSLYNRRCFNFFKAKKSWGNAEKSCLSMGGNLASIHSSAEHKFLLHMLTRHGGGRNAAWVGGSDAAQERMWLWSDGLPMQYTAWAPIGSLITIEGIRTAWQGTGAAATFGTTRYAVGGIHTSVSR